MTETRFGAIVVCGGKSTRMGSPKALLPFGDEVLLQRMVRIVREAIDGPIVVVAAAGQALPLLPVDVDVVVDENDGRGPMEGLRAGMKRLSERCDVAYVTSCDAPLLHSAVVRKICEATAGVDAAAPRAAGYLQPLAAAYRVDVVLPHIEDLLAADRRRPMLLFERVKTNILDEAALVDVDPKLDSLRNLNTPDDYRAALRDAGFA